MRQTDTIRAKFRKLWVYYILQSLLAATTLAIIAMILGKERAVLISAMGGTTFILFAMPKAVSAQTRNVVGGHVVGLVSGALLHLAPLPFYLQWSCAVALATFLMVALDVEHPPAAATSLAVIIHRLPGGIFAIVILSSLLLTQVRYYLRHYLRDLV